MSRICVKNLPKHVSEDRLREFFSQKGEVTDAKIMRTKDGRSRQFGFVGYRTEREAEEAIKYFNMSFMDAFRISCEIALKVGDSNIQRPWSRHSLAKMKGSSEGKKLDGARDVERKQKEDNVKVVDPQLQEFLEVMQHRSMSKMWANDTIAAPIPLVGQYKEALDDKQEIPKISEDNFSELDETDVDGKSVKDEPELQNPVNGKFLSDVDYLKSRIKKVWSDSESTDGEDAADDRDSHVSQEKHSNEPLRNKLEVEANTEYGGSAEQPMNDMADPSSTPENQILESGRLFIRNLPYSAIEEELEEHFSKYGTITQVHIVIDKTTRHSKGIGYVQFDQPESSARALEEMDSSIFQGRLLHVMPAKQKVHFPVVQSDDMFHSKTLKQERESQRKASEASGNTRAWNSLFMHPDTVVENITRKVGISKSELLDRESDELAVKIALGETQVIAETKKALISAGVNVSLLEECAAGRTDGLKRSNHVILVKNLPYVSTESELSDMFSKFGSLDKIILPRTKTLALAIFLEPVEARAAFKGLAYKRYKDRPLYLEWAPADILNQDSSPNDSKISGDVNFERALLEREVGPVENADIDPDRVESRSLYVKNLNFRTSEENLKKHFVEHMKEGKILSARVKKHLKNGKNVSMGFGFLEFDSVDTAVNVCKDLQGTVLDGHALLLQLCHAKKDELSSKKTKSDSSTKLIVKNVAFEATVKDLKQLFSPFGQIKRLRLPMRIGKHRGFAFVEYVTKQEARNALEALSNTHLYGRHLVLELAKEGESLEDLRAKTAAQFSDANKLSQKRKQMTILDEGNMKLRKVVE